MNQENKTEYEMLAQMKASPIYLAPVTLTMREISGRSGDQRSSA